MLESALDGDAQHGKGRDDHLGGGADETITVNLSDSTDRSVIDIALAEFNALRAEIITHQNIQAALIGVGLTAIGVLIGVALKDGGSGSSELLLAVPPISVAIVLLRTAYNIHVVALGNYIGSELLPFLKGRVCVDALPSWENRASGHRNAASTLFLAVFVYGAGTGMFCAGSVVSMLLVTTSNTALIVMGWACTVATAAVPAILFIATRVMDWHPIE